MTATMSDKELSLLSIQEDQVAFNQKQKEALIDVLRVRHATEADLAVFFHLCRQRQLDPFLRQIYMLARQEWDKEAQARVWRQTFQTGIDGFRTIAARRAAKLRTQLSYEPTIYVDNDGVGHEYWVKDEPPAAVKVTVKLGDSPFPFVARFSDYVVLGDEYEDVLDEQGKPKYKNGKKESRKTGRRVPSGMWATRPTGQLEKCAEASALRRACPEDLGGIYEFAEMEDTTEPMVHLVDDGSGVHSPTKPAKKGTSTVGSLIWKIQRAKDRPALLALYEEAKAAGMHQRPDVEKAFADRGRKLQANAPSTGQESPGEPSDPADSAESGAQSSVQPEDLPYVMRERLWAAGVRTTEAAQALSIEDRDRILGVAAWGGDEDSAYAWAAEHVAEQESDGDE